MKHKAISFALLSKLIGPLMFIIVFVCYHLSFKGMIEMYRNYNSLRDGATENERLSVSPSYTSSRMKQVDLLYEQFSVDTLNWKNKLLNYSAVLSQKYSCSVVAFPPWKLSRLNGRALFLQGIGFKGRFVNLLSLLKELENRKEIGRVSNVLFSRTGKDAETTLFIGLSGLSIKDVDDE